MTLWTAADAAAAPLGGGGSGAAAGSDKDKKGKGKGKRGRGMLFENRSDFDGRGVLILGPSGAGKSGLALQLMALGARLVADDRTRLNPRAGRLIARAPSAIAGRIEARGLGILAADALQEAPVTLIVDPGQTETDRLPPERRLILLGCTVPLCHGSSSGHFPAAIVQYLRAGRIA